MDVIHHITFNTNHVRYATDYFKKIGIKIKETNSGTSVIDIGENDKRWLDVRKFIDEHPTDIRDFQDVTQFTKAEMDNADFFSVHPKWHHQYPQPDDFGYKAITYDSTKICSKCDIEHKQIAPFSITRNPKWGRRNILQLNWVFDEYFVSADLKSRLENECGLLNFRAVKKHRKNEMLDDIYQLDIKQAVDLDMPSEAKFKVCELCKQKKYLPHTRGFCPSPKNDNFVIAHSMQYFGDMHKAFHEVLINKDIYKLFIKTGVNGVSFIPCSAR